MSSDSKSKSNVTIWHLDPARVTAPRCIETLKTWLSEVETERMVRFHQAKHQHAFLVCHALKRAALADVLGLNPAELDFGVGSYGRPYLLGHSRSKVDLQVQGEQQGLINLQFNLSHTDGMVAIAVSQDAFIGLDVENLNRKIPETAFAARFFTPTEHDDILAHEHTQDSHRLLEYWTLKEAFIKAEGLGISIGLDTFYFDLTQAQPNIHFTPEARPPSHPWQFMQIKHSAMHLMALAWAPQIDQTKQPAMRNPFNNQALCQHVNCDVRAADSLLNVKC